jgi:hypothetical protein
MSPLERKQVFAEFNYILAPRKEEIKELCAQILNNAVPIVYSNFKQYDIFISHTDFENDEIAQLDRLFELMNQNSTKTAEVLFGAYYYELVATAMVTVLATKMADYIQNHTGELVKFKFTGYSARHCLHTSPTAGLVCSGGTAWDDKYYAVLIHLPELEDYIDKYNYGGGLQSILEFGLMVGFSINDSKLFPTSMNYNIPVEDLGIQLKEKYFNKIKEIVAKQI